MNLADALRRVNSEGQPLPGPQAAASEPGSERLAEVPVAQPADPVQIPDVAHPHVAGNIVRLELFLSAEQMGGLFRAIMAGQHTVLTLREAAAYLRIGQDSLLKLAEEGEIPGVQIEGRWRFPKPNLDDWMTLQSVVSEDTDHVA